jgi:anti-sigma B factor antagonist
MRVEAVDGCTVVTLAGELDASSAPMLSGALDAVITAGRSLVIVDLSDVTFLGAAGLGVFVKARNELRAKRHELILRSASPMARRILGACQLLSMVDDFEASGHSGAHDHAWAATGR